MKICEEKYKQLPDNLKALFVKLPNPGSDEVVGLFPQTKSGAMHGVYKNTMMKGQPGIRDGKEVLLHQEASEGSAARFFYVAKASKAERGEGNNHVTVKPLKLMCYLCRLVTPPGGTVLDCYVGSGTTGVAAQIEGFDFIGIDKDIDIATDRLKRHREQVVLPL